MSNATASVRSPIKNLVDVNPHVQMNRLISAIGWEYLRTKPLAIEDGGYDFIQQQKGFQLINPTEDWFPGTYKKYHTLVLEINILRIMRNKSSLSQIILITENNNVLLINIQIC